MFNKLHYDAKFMEMIGPGTVLSSTSVTSATSGDKDIKVTDADRVAMLVSFVCASVIKAHTITVHKVNSGGTGDVAIPFDICRITETTGAYGTWTAAESTGHSIAAASLEDGNHLYLIEVDKAQFVGNDDYATPLEYLQFTIAAADADETGTITGGVTAILYGLKYQTED